LPRDKKLKVTLIGAGSVGATLARLLKRRGHSIVSVISKTRKSARALAAHVNCRIAGDDVSAIPPETSFVLITTPESAIEQTAQSIASVNGLAFDRMYAAHTSGALSSDVLSPLSNRGSRIFSFHPIQSFPRNRGASIPLESMKGVWYGFEGPRNARLFARTLASTLGGKFLEVPKEKKILYHLACVFASNYSVVVLGAVERLARHVSGGDLLPFRKLFESSGENAFRLGASGALTGPIARGSANIIHRHMAELSLREPELLTVYSALGLYALEILNVKGLLNEDDLRQIASLLAGNDDR
jgi:predicted short-subunit dehydrogenase-like oxidoreductase (DUF2520 family)